MDHDAYWSEFDDWAIRARSEAVDAALAALLRVLPGWSDLLRRRRETGDGGGGGADGPDEDARHAHGNQENGAEVHAWREAIATPVTSTAISLLSDRERATVRRHYGLPVRLDDLIEAYVHFGRGAWSRGDEREDDPLRGPTYWLVWGGLADACLTLELRPVFWRKHTRAFLAGLMADGAHRGRFPITGIREGISSEELAEYVQGLTAEEVRSELRRRLAESGLTVEV